MFKGTSKCGFFTYNSVSARPAVRDKRQKKKDRGFKAFRTNLLRSAMIKRESRCCERSSSDDATKEVLTRVRSKLPDTPPFGVPEAINSAAITSGSARWRSFSARASLCPANSPNACREKRSTGMIQARSSWRVPSAYGFSLISTKLVTKGPAIRSQRSICSFSTYHLIY